MPLPIAAAIMDFASLMKAELDAKKAKLNAAKAQAGKSYMKQKDIREAEAEVCYNICGH